MKTNTYFQLPLCAFAFGKTAQERLDAIISYCLVETGHVLWQRISETQRDKLLQQWQAQGFPVREQWQVAALCAANRIGVTPGSLSVLRERQRKLRQFVAHFESRHGKDGSVRLRKDLLFEARDKKGITPPELSVLAAIYSIIGDKKAPVLITRARIRQRALGYKSKGVFDAELSKRADKAQPLSEWKLRNIIDRLHQRKFFRRLTYGRRHTYYSHRMTEKAFREAIFEKKTRREVEKFAQRIAEKELTDAIRNQRAILQGKAPPRPNAKPFIFKAPDFEP